MLRGDGRRGGDRGQRNAAKSEAPIGKGRSPGGAVRTESSGKPQLAN